MIWFIAIIVGAYLIGEVCRKGSDLLEEERAYRERSLALNEFYKNQCLNELHCISSSLNGPEMAPLSHRIGEAQKDVKRRREVQRAMEKELGIR